MGAGILVNKNSKQDVILIRKQHILKHVLEKHKFRISIAHTPQVD